MLRNMVTSLFEYERIQTTDAKAKELRKLADKMVTLAKRGDLHARRQALAVIRSKNVIKKLFDEIKERYLPRNGGYTRIMKKGYRPGDAAPVSIIELIPSDTGKVKPKAKKPTKKVSQTKDTDKVKPKTKAAQKVSDQEPGEEKKGTE